MYMNILPNRFSKKKFTFPKRQVSEVLTTFPAASIYNPQVSRRWLNIPGLWDILWNWELGRRKAGRSWPGVSWDGNEATCFSLFLLWVNLPLLFLKLWNGRVLLPFLFWGVHHPYSKIRAAQRRCKWTGSLSGLWCLAKALWALVLMKSRINKTLITGIEVYFWQ